MSNLKFEVGKFYADRKGGRERLRNEDVFFDVKLDWSATQFEVQ